MPGNLSTIDRYTVREAGVARDQGVASPGDLDLLCTLRGWFSVDFHLLDGDTGEVLRGAPEQEAMEFTMLGPLGRVVAQRGRAELLDDEDPLIVLAIPMGPTDRSRVAVGVFVAATALSDAHVERTAGRLGRSPEETASWLGRQARWTSHALLTAGQISLRTARGRVSRGALGTGSSRSVAAMVHQP